MRILLEFRVSDKGDFLLCNFAQVALPGGVVCTYQAFSWLYIPAGVKQSSKVTFSRLCYCCIVCSEKQTVFSEKQIGQRTVCFSERNIYFSERTVYFSDQNKSQGHSIPQLRTNIRIPRIWMHGTLWTPEKPDVHNAPIIEILENAELQTLLTKSL